jgi:GNAT superfamily N-acetyltransferase
MPLPILNHPTSPGGEDLLRFYDHTQKLWSEHLAEAVQLDVGTAYANVELPGVDDANRILDAALPDGMTAAAAVKAAHESYLGRGGRCMAWVMNPSAPFQQNRPLIEYLLESGFAHRRAAVMYLKKANAQVPPSPVRLQIIPARASFRHVRVLAEEFAAQRRVPQLADAVLLHLDDPHWDSFLALDGTIPVGMAGVMTAGNVGRIDQVFVSESYRRRGAGKLLISRVLETCARSLLKHVMLGVSEDNLPAISLYQKFGFARIGAESSYHPPSTT